MKIARILLSAAVIVSVAALCAGCKAEDDIQPTATPKPKGPDVVVNNEIDFNEHVIEVWGYGTVIAAPDYCTIKLGVRGEADTAEQARELCEENYQNMYDALLQLGVRAKDIAAAGIFITANTRESDGVVLGYVATDTVTISAQDLAAANNVMSAAIDAGASDIHGTTYWLTDVTTAYQEALNKAMADALQKAAVLAEAAGVTLGQPIGIVEAPNDDSALIGVGFDTSAIAVPASVNVRYLIHP